MMAPAGTLVPEVGTPLKGSSCRSHGPVVFWMERSVYVNRKETGCAQGYETFIVRQNPVYYLQTPIEEHLIVLWKAVSEVNQQ